MDKVFETKLNFIEKVYCGLFFISIAGKAVVIRVHKIEFLFPRREGLVYEYVLWG